MPRKLVHTGKKIQVFLETETAADGTLIHRDLIQHPGAVAILPVFEDNRVCLLRNRRPNVGGVLLEIPAGTLEPGEAPEHAAARELTEESGYRAKKWRKLCEFYPSPGVLNEKLHMFVASELVPGNMRPEPDEDLEPQIFSWAQAVAWSLDGTIQDAKTIVALLMWDRIRGEQYAVSG